MEKTKGKRVSLQAGVVVRAVLSFVLLFLFCGQGAAGSPADVPSFDEAPSVGKFLIAAERMTDPRFSETVVLLIHYGLDGAVGLIVNRPTTVKLSSLLPDVKELRKRPDTAFIGGPVGMTQLFMLVRSASPPAESLPVLRGVYVSTSTKLLERIAGKGGKEKFRLYAGYAGWAAGQLEQELARGDWRILPADAGTIFDADPARIWQDLNRRSSAIRIQGEMPDAAVQRRLSF